MRWYYISLPRIPVPAQSPMNLHEILLGQPTLLSPDSERHNFSFFCFSCCVFACWMMSKGQVCLSFTLGFLILPLTPCPHHVVAFSLSLLHSPPSRSFWDLQLACPGIFSFSFKYIFQTKRLSSSAVTKRGGAQEAPPFLKIWRQLTVPRGRGSQSPTSV